MSNVHKLTRLSGTQPLSKKPPTLLTKHKNGTYPPTHFAKLGSLFSKNNHKGPRRFQRGLFGNAQISKGYNVTFSDKRNRRFWKPNVFRLRLYSEILDRRLRIRCTAAVLRAIDYAGGLDNYLLKTPVESLHSRFGRSLRDLLIEMRQLNKEQKDYAAKVEEYARALVEENPEALSKKSIQHNLHKIFERKARGHYNLTPFEQELYNEHMRVLDRKQEILDHVDKVYANYLGRREPAWSKQTMYVPSHSVNIDQLPDSFPMAQQIKQDNEDHWAEDLKAKFTTGNKSNDEEV